MHQAMRLSRAKSGSAGFGMLLGLGDGLLLGRGPGRAIRTTTTRLQYVLESSPRRTRQAGAGSWGNTPTHGHAPPFFRRLRGQGGQRVFQPISECMPGQPVRPHNSRCRLRFRRWTGSRLPVGSRRADDNVASVLGKDETDGSVAEYHPGTGSVPTGGTSSGVAGDARVRFAASGWLDEPRATGFLGSSIELAARGGFPCARSCVRGWSWGWPCAQGHPGRLRGMNRFRRPGDGCRKQPSSPSRSRAAGDPRPRARVEGHERRHREPAFKAWSGSSGFQQFVQVVRVLEIQVGTEWKPGLNTLVEGGITGAILPGGGSLLIVDSGDEDLLGKLHDVLIQGTRDDAAKNGRADPVASRQVRGVTTWSIGGRERTRSSASGWSWRARPRHSRPSWPVESMPARRASTRRFATRPPSRPQVVRRRPRRTST